MKKINFLILGIILIFIGCCRKAEYYSFTDEEKSLLLYEEGDTFKLKNNNNNDTLICKAANKKIHYQYMKSYFSGCDMYSQVGKIEFIYNNKKIVYIKEDKNFGGTDDFIYEIYILGILGHGIKEKGITINVNGKDYYNVYLIAHPYHEYLDKIYISPEKGIIKAENDSITYTIVE